MTTAAASSVTGLRATKSRIGLVVLGAVASGLALGLLLVLAVFVGGPEHEITGAALFALGSGFVLLALASRRFTDQPQDWALVPGLATAFVGMALFALAPGDRALGLAGWVWPILLLVLVGWSFRGVRRSLNGWCIGWSESSSLTRRILMRSPTRKRQSMPAPSAPVERSISFQRVFAGVVVRLTSTMSSSHSIPATASG